VFGSRQLFHPTAQVHLLVYTPNATRGGQLARSWRPFAVQPVPGGRMPFCLVLGDNRRRRSCAKNWRHGNPRSQKVPMTDGNSRPVLLHGYAPLIPAPMAPNEAARTRGDRPSSKPLGLTKRSECDRPGRDGMQPTFPKREVAAIRRHVRITVICHLHGSVHTKVFCLRNGW